jgi:putative transposase
VVTPATLLRWHRRLVCAPPTNPSGAWATQQARTVCGDLVERGADQPRFLIHDRDSKFSGAFDQIFRSEATIVLRTPIQAPNANAHAERGVRTVRNDCLDRILILARRQLEHVLRVNVTHYNEHRPHRSLDLCPPAGPARRPSSRPPASLPTLHRRDLLGGLIHEYSQAA